MSDEHDDLLNFEIIDGDFAEGTLNEDELLLSDEDRDDFDEDQPASITNQEALKLPVQSTLSEEPVEVLVKTVEQTDTGQKASEEELESKIPVERTPVVHQSESNVNATLRQPFAPNAIAPRPPYRQKFQRWPNQPPRWIPPTQQPLHQMQFQRGTNMILRPPGHGPGPQRQMRPRPPFFSNNFMQSRPLLRPAMVRPRFFYSNQGPLVTDPSMPGYVPTPIMTGQGHSHQPIPRKVLINPNFKGGVEAAKNQLLKDQFFSSSLALPEEELLRKQQEFINHNMRQIEKRRHERTPSPEYRRGYSHSMSPPRYRRKPNRNFEGTHRREFGRNEPKGKDENLPEEDEETRAYRQQIDTQKKKREEILKQKEMRRKQQVEQKSKETQPTEPLQPIVVTDKKIVLKRKTPDRSTTPPIKDAPITPSRRIVLKPTKESKGSELKPALADGSKRKIQKILSS